MLVNVNRFNVKNISYIWKHAYKYVSRGKNNLFAGCSHLLISETHA